MRVGLLVFVVACGGDNATPEEGSDDYRLDLPCANAVLGGDLIPKSNDLGRWDELFVTHGCELGTGQTIGYDGRGLVGLIETPAVAGFINFEPVRVIPGGLVVAIQEVRRGVMRIGPGAGQAFFGHTVDDIVFADVDANGSEDYVTVGEHLIRRASMATGFDIVDPAEEMTLLAGKTFRYVAVGEFGGSPLPDLFYVTADGDIGMALQAAPDIFIDQPLASDPGTPQRFVVADVDGDGRDDVIGASGHMFVWASRTGAVAMGEPAVAFGVGDFELDGLVEPVFIASDQSSVRRLSVADMTSEVWLDAGGDAIGVADIDGDLRSDIALIHDAGTPTAWVRIYRAFSVPSE